MAAAILMTSATVSASGTSIAIPTSGSNGTLSPTTAITGFSVSVSGVAYTISAATAATSIVTLTVTPTVPISAVVTVTVVSGSNLTDSASHTVVGQAAFAAVNNSAFMPDVYNVRSSFTYDNGNKVGTLITNNPYLTSKPNHTTLSTAKITNVVVPILDEVYGISIPIGSNTKNDVSIVSNASKAR